MYPRYLYDHSEWKVIKIKISFSIINHSSQFFFVYTGSSPIQGNDVNIKLESCYTYMYISFPNSLNIKSFGKSYFEIQSANIFLLFECILQLFVNMNEKLLIIFICAFHVKVVLINQWLSPRFMESSKLFTITILLFLNITWLYWICQQAWSVSTILTGLLSFMVNYCLTLLLECINSYFENPFCYSWKRVLLWEALKQLTMKRDVLLSKVWNSILEIKFSMNYFQILQ